MVSKYVKPKKTNAMIYGNTADVKILPQKTATVPVQKNTANPFTTLSKVSDSQFGYLPNQPKNYYGGEWQIGTQTSMMDLMKKKPEEIKAWVKKQEKDTRNNIIEWVMSKMDTGEPITANEIRTMARWANEDDLWDALDSAMAEWAMIEWLNREKPVEVSWIDKFLRKIPWVTTLQQWISWASSWVMKWVWATIQWLWDAGNRVASQAERINPFNTSGDGSWLFSTPESRAAWVAWQQQFGTDLNTAVDENIATPLMDRYNSSVATEDRNSTPFAVWQELGKIWVTAAATAPLWWAWLLWKAPLLARVAMWALEWVAWNALYNKASWAEYWDNAKVAGWIGAAIPFAWAVLWAGARMFWKKAEALAVKWLLNASDAKKVVQQLAETGQGDVWSLWRWALDKWIAWKSEQWAISALKEIARAARSTVKSVIDDVSSMLWPIGKNIDVENAMTMVAKKADSVNASAWFNAVDMTEINALREAASNGTLSLSQVQRSKELIDEFVSIYKKSWDVGDSALADAGAKLRNSIKNFIEDAVDTATNWEVNIRWLNRDTAVANTMLRWIETKSVSNSLRQYAMQSTLWSVAWSWWQFDPTNPEWIWKVIVGAFLWRAAWSIMSNPRVLWNIAKMMDTLSFGTRNSLLQYMKNPKTASLTDDAIEEISKAKSAIENIDEVKAVMAKTTKASPLEPVMSKTKNAITKAKTTKNPLSPIMKNDVIDNASSAIDPATDTVSPR